MTEGQTTGDRLWRCSSALAATKDAGVLRSRCAPALDVPLHCTRRQGSRQQGHAVTIPALGVVRLCYWPKKTGQKHRRAIRSSHWPDEEWARAHAPRRSNEFKGARRPSILVYKEARAAPAALSRPLHMVVPGAPLRSRARTTYPVPRSHNVATGAKYPGALRRNSQIGSTVRDFHGAVRDFHGLRGRHITKW